MKYVSMILIVIDAVSENKNLSLRISRSCCCASILTGNLRRRIVADRALPDKTVAFDLIAL